MCKPDGFTLIELMVVIAIIALLLAVLMPALAGARQQAKAVTCQSNLNQWGKVFMMYTMDNDGHFASGVTKDGRPIMWTESLAPYTKEPEMRLCPMATKLASEVSEVTGFPYGNKFLAWGKFGPEYAYYGLEGFYGSYGMNGHVSNEPLNVNDPYERNLANIWRRCDVRGANNIPLFLDCVTLGAMPECSDEPPQYDGDIVFHQGEPDHQNDPDMKAFCIDRHNEAINGLFMDWSVRKIGLKQLWKLKWHQQFDTNADPPVWPIWMRNFKDF